MEQENMLGKRVELVVHLKDQILRLRQGLRGTVTTQFRDAFNVPLRVAWDDRPNRLVHYDEIRVVGEEQATRAVARP